MMKILNYNLTKSLVAGLFFAVVFNIYAQEKIQVSGKVKDIYSEPLPGATVSELGRTNGIITDLEGNFTLTVASDASIMVSYVGFLSQTIKVSGRTNIEIILKEDVETLSEVVVVGYGSQKKSDLTGSVAVISIDRIDAKPNTNFNQALQGALTGVSVTLNSSGAEQNDMSILIRGRNSIKASNSPLIILDGVPYSGSVSDINTADIKSITVLKDASSTAIYGSRGANGVILIESKKGLTGDPKISYSGYYGITTLGNIPKIYNGQGFAEFKEEREPGELTDSELAVLNSSKSTDWIDLTTQNGIRQEHNLSVSGASDKSKYYISLGYHDAKGVSINDIFRRASLRFNLSYDVTKSLSFGTSTQLTRIDRSGLNPTFGGDHGAYFMNPLTSAYDEDGNLTIYPWPEDEYFRNPLAPTIAINDDINNKVFTTNYMEWHVPWVEGLSYKINTGVEFGAQERGTYWGRNTAIGFASNGEAEIRNTKTENYLIEHLLNYTKNFGEHSIAFTGLYSAQKTIYSDRETNGVGFPTDVLTYNQMDLAIGAVTDIDFEQTTLVSQMGRLNYSFKDKYLITATVRRDGFSGFGENNKYGVFPSVALGWNIGNEDFLSVDAISSAKVRASFGVNGNQAVGPYDNLARLSSRSYVNGSTTASGFIPSDLANNELSWEQTQTLNIGLDLGVLEDRFQLSIDAYNALTTDLLLDRLIPSVHGITTITQNVGEVRNQGLEFALSGYPINKDVFNWNISGNLSFNRNEIVSLFGKDQDDVGNQLFIGEPIRVNYGYVLNGIWQTDEDPTISAQPSAQPGDVKVKDISNSLDDDGNPILGISADYDRDIQGQRDPKMIWGMENSFTYKNISLYVFIHGVTGITKRNTIKDENVYGGVRRNWFVLDHWTPENASNTFHRNSIDANLFNVAFYENANFARIKDITLSYNFDNSLFGNTGINGARIYFTGRNLLTITDWGGLDPELNDQFSVPLQKEFVLGLNFSF